jgi:hypothetical protein
MVRPTGSTVATQQQPLTLPSNASTGPEHVTIFNATSNKETYIYLADSFHPDDGGDTFLRNVNSYKRHTV